MINVEFNTPLPPKSINWMTNYPQPTLIAFIWNTYSPDCPAIHYNILASNCGNCPNTTNHTTAICTGVPTDNSMCTFAVQTVACGNITGESNQVLLFNNIPGQLVVHMPCWPCIEVGNACLILFCRQLRMWSSSHLCCLSWCDFGHLPYWLNNNDHTLDKIKNQGWNFSGEYHSSQRPDKKSFSTTIFTCQY